MADIIKIKKDLIAYSAKMVQDKRMFTRIINSNNSAISSIRRGAQAPNQHALAGMLKKTVPGIAKTVIKSPIKAMPVLGKLPVIPGVINIMTDNVFSMCQTRIRNRNLAQAYKTGNEADIFKFTLKNFSMADIDSYRQKLDVALNKYNAVVKNATRTLEKDRKEGAVCHFHIEMCMASAQVERRITKLIDAYSAIDTIASEIRKRILAVSNDFTASESLYWAHFKDTLDMHHDASHSHCNHCLVKGDLHTPLDARFASFVANNKVFSALIKSSLESAHSEVHARVGSSITNKIIGT